VKPTRQAKYRQVEEFLRLLDASLTEAMAQGQVRMPTEGDPLRIVDLGCGNAYLTFAAHRFLTAPVEDGGRGLPVRMTGVDVKQQSADHNAEVAAGLGIDADFVVGSIQDATLPSSPDVVLALHACDTATDDALARALGWGASLVLAAPCCHHDIAAQLRTAEAPGPYAMLTRYGILRERFADTLTDALRASLLRREGYRVDVVEFVESAHTPRNTLLRAVRLRGQAASHRRSSDVEEAAGREYDDLLAAWGVRPRLGELLSR
jgi:SAM-dependent methyltransferase